MKGQVLDFSVQTNSGIISGNDNQRYQFNGAQWHDQRLPARGIPVDFDVDSNGYATSIYILSTSNSFTPIGQSTGQKSRIAAALLAFFLGGFGVHKFYLGRVGWGIIYLIFFWTFIPAIIAFIEFIIYLCTSDEDFAKKYG